VEWGRPASSRRRGSAHESLQSTTERSPVNVDCVWHPIDRPAHAVPSWFTCAGLPETIAMVIAVMGVRAFGLLVLNLIGSD
jgi:hypothetical protein